MKISNYFIILVTLMVSQSALAFPSLKLTATPNTTSFAALSGGELKTVNSGLALTPQAVSLDYQGDLSGLFDVSTAFYSLSGVKTTGTATQANSLVSQNTSGGTLNIWSDGTFSNLLLSGNLGAGVISGQAGSTQAKYETWTLNVTGGSVLSKLPNPMLDLSLNYQLNGCLVFSKRCFLASTGNPTVGISNGNFNDFTANFIDGLSIGKTLPPTNPPPVTPIPEPASLLLLGAAAGSKALWARRKKQIQNA